MQDSTVTANTAKNGGGVAIYDACVPTLNNSVLVGNNASSYGGGLYLLQDSYYIMVCFIIYTKFVYLFKQEKV